MGKNNMPEKASTTEGIIDQLWLAVFNHIPSRLNVMDMKVNFIMAFMGLILALVAIILVLVR